MAAQTALQFHSALKAAIKRGIVVLNALGDAEMRFQSTSQVWSRAVDDGWLAYGSNETRVRFVPTAREIAQAEIVSDWLMWLGKHHGPENMPRLVSWAHDDPIWRIAERERCSERTVHYRIDRSVALILKEFGDLELDIPVVDEKPAPANPFFVTERPTVAEHGARLDQHGKVWIDGVGFMKNGKRWNDGRNKVSERMLRGH